MKVFFTNFLIFITNFFSVFYSFERNNTIKYYKNILYSYWVLKSIGNYGRNIHIQSPAYIKGGQYISIGENFNSLESLKLECWGSYNEFPYSPKLEIGNNVSMNSNIHIGCINQIIIGDNVLFASNIFITDHYHGYIDERDLGIAPVKRNLNSKGSVIIKSNVWIGEYVTILPNVIIGENSIIGANSVVNKNIPANSVAAGNPVKVIRILELIK